MPKLSIILPSRDEKFLVPTIHDIFRNARGETEVIAVIDSDKWPENWKQVTDQYPNLHTIFHGKPLGMRRSINDGVGSAVSRGAKYVMKADAHCSFSEGFDEVLLKDIEPDWVVVPRRGRLDPEAWIATETHKPDIDYHYLSFPDNPDDFGGPGLNGKPWDARAKERARYDLDEEMSSQGSCWLMSAAYFEKLELMDEAHWGTFWCEFQEIGFRCWLSGGRVMINKKAKYLHLHKGKKYGRGYRLDEKELKKGRNQAMLWSWNEEWSKQTLPFKWLIEHFWPVPTWPENWEEILYATRKPRVVSRGVSVSDSALVSGDGNTGTDNVSGSTAMLKIHKAHYGIGSLEDIDVRAYLQNLAYLNNDALDIIVNNSTLTPGQNPFRGKKKQLNITYSIDGGDVVTRTVQEKDWLIIGPSGRAYTKSEADLEPQSNYVVGSQPVESLGSKAAAEFIARRDGREDDVRPVRNGDKKFCPYCGRLLPLNGGRFPAHVDSPEREVREVNPVVCKGSGKEYEVVSVVREKQTPTTAAALNDYLIRKFNISPQRLRGPMPIELRDFHRNDLAQLFAELGFNRGAEIGVAEGNYSEIICKANPDVELFCIDLWESYPTNPQAKTSDRHEFAYSETKRKLAGYNARLFRESSIDAVMKFDSGELDFVYVDANHLYDFVSLDLIMWSNKVRSGGIVSGDDYYALDQKRWVGGGVVEAVQAYTNAHRIPIWYIFQGHKSTDFMWVKP